MSGPGRRDGPLLFSHIPKTAGTSLKNLLLCSVPDTLLVYGGELALGAPDIAFIQRFRERPRPPLVMGHFSYGVHRLLGILPRYVSVLRHPIDRVVSLYRHQRRVPDSPFKEQMEAGMSLRDFVASGITETTNNHMCRIVAGIPPEAGMVINKDWLYDLAVHNLELHYEIVGTIDEVPRVAQQVAASLGIAAAAVPFDNVAGGEAPALDESTLRTIIDFNLLDLRLYEHVSARRGS